MVNEFKQMCHDGVTRHLYGFYVLIKAIYMQTLSIVGINLTFQIHS